MRKKFEFDVASVAAALFDGGWRASDRDECMNEYGLSADQWDEIEPWLARWEAVAK